MGLAYTSKNKIWHNGLQQDNTRKYNYYVAVFAYNEVLYADSKWYAWPILWPKNKVLPLKSYESAVGVSEEVGDYVIQHNLSWQIEIQWEPK